MDQRRIAGLSGQTILCGNGHIASRGEWLDPFRKGLFVAACEAAAMKMNCRHPFRGHAGGRPIDIELQFHFAGLAVDDVAFDSDFALRLFRHLQPGRAQRGNCRPRQRRSNETSSAQLAHCLTSVESEMNIDKGILEHKKHKRHKK